MLDIIRCVSVLVFGNTNQFCYCGFCYVLQSMMWMLIRIVICRCTFKPQVCARVSLLCVEIMKNYAMEGKKNIFTAHIRKTKKNR